MRYAARLLLLSLLTILAPLGARAADEEPAGDEKKADAKAEAGDLKVIDNEKTFTAVITAAQLNARSGAGAEYAVVETLRKDEKVEVIVEKDGWYEIDYPRIQEAWISRRYVELPEGGLPADGTVTGNNIRVRSDASLNSDILGLKNKGDAVRVTKVDGDWCRIEFKKRPTCWIHSRYAEPADKPAFENGMKARKDLLRKFRSAETLYEVECAKESIADMKFGEASRLYGELLVDGKVSESAKKLIGRRLEDVKRKEYYGEQIRLLNKFEKTGKKGQGKD